MKKIGVYIHIPFCKQKCYYCDFVSFANQKLLQKEYFKQLKNEIKNFFFKNEYEVSTIYIGGGTPSFVDEIFIKEVLELILKNNVKEITIEVNPGTVNFEKLKLYKEIGINRLSIGLQSTQNRLLKQIGRIHTFEDFLNTYKMAQQVGFNNINIDLMIGLPNQTIADIKQSLETVIKLNPKHISVYSLIIEENTKIAKLVENGELKLLDEETERNMYWYVKNYLELNGYIHYEISNFAQKGYESKHNMDCWNQEEYIGFGLAAHSYLNNTRFSNTTDLKKYIENGSKNELDKNIIIQEVQEDYSKKQEYMLLGLRKIDGVSIQKFKNKFGDNPLFLFRKELNKLVDECLLIVENDNIKLTNKGIDLANLVWEEFVSFGDGLFGDGD